LILKIILPGAASSLFILLAFFMMRQNKKSKTPVQDGSQLIRSTRKVAYFELSDAINNLVKAISLEQELLVYRAMP